MAAPDAVASTAIARREVRNSLERLEYHLGRGTKGGRGVAREMRFLDALHRQSVTNAGAAVGRAYTTNPLQSFGTKAARALSTGNSSTVGRMKSSLLADFSADSLTPVRLEADLLGEWLWTANASACPTCLNKNGQVFRGPFRYAHPSCLCIPQPIGTPGLRPLTDGEMSSVLETYGSPRYQNALRRFRSGEMSRAEFVGIEEVNATAAGQRAVAEHVLKGEVSQTGLPGGVAQETFAPPAPAPIASEYVPPAPPGSAGASISEGFETYLGRFDVKATKANQATFKAALGKIDDMLAGSPQMQSRVKAAADHVGSWRLNKLKNTAPAGRGYTLGHYGEIAKVPQRGIIQKELMLQMDRYNTDEVIKYRATLKSELLAKQTQLLDDGLGDVGARLRTFETEWKAKNKAPKYTRPATADEVADTLIHELTHVIDVNSHPADYTAIAKTRVPSPMRGSALDEIFEEVERIYKGLDQYADDIYKEDFWYAASRDGWARKPMPGETMAEMSRMYFNGIPDPSVTWNPPLSGVEWRARYPQLAEWVEKTIMGGEVNF